MKGARDKVLLVIGLIGVAGFLYLYTVKLFGLRGPPPTMAWMEGYVGPYGLIVINILVFACFLALLPYRSPGESAWKSKGAFAGFLIALFTEMFGLPLLVFFFSPLFDYPFVLPSFRKFMGPLGMILGTWLTLGGIVLVVMGWRKIHRATGLVTGGIYAHIRHPQYVGLFLIMLGWLLHWPTLLTLILFPLLLAVYYWLSRQEERQMLARFGDQYRVYAAATPRFFPRLFKRTASA